MDRADTVAVATTLSLSAPTCSRKGDPPLIVTIKHLSTAPRAIWALVYRFSEWGAGIEIRDLEHHRHRGPSPLWAAYAHFDEDPDPLENVSLERIAPGQSLETSYTLSVGKKLGDIPSDVQRLEDGKAYGVTLRKPKWWWMFEDEMPAACTTDDERREVLGKRTVCTWKPECLGQSGMVG